MGIAPTAPPQPQPLSARTASAWFGVYALIGVLSFTVLKDAIAGVVPVWLPVGVSFALQLRASPRQRVVIAIAQFLLEFTIEQLFGVYQSLPLHVAYSTAVALESYVAATLAIRLNGRRPLTLGSVSELAAFLAAAVVATVLGGALASIVELRIFPEEQYVIAVLAWVQADLVGFVVLTPLVLSALDGAEIPPRRMWLNAIAYLATLSGAATLLFGRHIEPRSPLVALPFLLFPPLIWGALSFGVVGAATGAVLLSILVGSLTELGLGPINALGLDTFSRQLIAQGFVGLLAFSALTLGVLTRQQRATRRSLESALAKAEEAAARFRAFFEGTPEMLAAVDREGHVVLANNRWMQEFSAFYNQENVIGLHFDALTALAGEEALATAGWWRRALAGESIVTPWSVSRWDGTTSVYEMSLAPLSDSAGRIVGAYMSVRDVADLRAKQEAESRARRLETVGRLAGGVAHDFNNIVTGMQGFVELLAGSLPPDHEGREDLEEIRKAGDRAAALTRQLLAYARRQLIEPRQVQVPELLHGLTALLRRVIGEGVELTVSLPADLWPVRADPGQLEQVIMNLAVNARDAMPTGGRLIIEGENIVVGQVDAPARDLAAGEYVAVTVTDTGEGMPPEVLERIFEPFYTTKQHGRGTGLGLATVDGIVRQIGGAISANSIEGLGSTMRIFLPRDAQPAEPAVETAASHPHLGREQVIVVEDDDSLRELARRVLEQRGYQVACFADGAGALAMEDALLARAALLVTDVVLPGIPGSVVAERLRARAPRLRVLFVSGYADAAVTEHGIADAEANFLSKPFTPEKFASKVRALLDRDA